MVQTHINELVNFKDDFQELKDRIERVITGDVSMIKTSAQENIIMAFSNKDDYTQKSLQQID